MQGKFVVKAVSVAAAAALLLGGCGLLPEEETAPSPPVIHSYEKVEYKLATVERGDIVERTKATFKYEPALRQTMSFPVDGVALAGVYVATGDVVEEGALVAELDDGGLIDRIAAQSEQVSDLEQSVASLRRDRELELRACDLKIAADPNNARLKDQRKSTVERYDDSISASTLRLDAARARLEELEASLEQRRMYAPFGGTVTYIKSFGADSFRSTAGETFMTISDKTTLSFTAEGQSAVAMFRQGERVEFLLSDETYASTITSVGDATVVLEPDEYIPGISEGSYGVVFVTTHAVYDVLRVPSSAVASANGQPIVYTLVDGVRTLREVEIGFSCDGYTEIISGLSEGEQVIA